jgi:hypothetical protein
MVSLLVWTRAMQWARGAKGLAQPGEKVIHNKDPWGMGFREFPSLPNLSSHDFEREIKFRLGAEEVRSLTCACQSFRPPTRESASSPR